MLDWVGLGWIFEDEVGIRNVEFGFGLRMGDKKFVSVGRIWWDTVGYGVRGNSECGVRSAELGVRRVAPKRRGDVLMVLKGVKRRETVFIGVIRNS
jgi:hypothetical protein